MMSLKLEGEGVMLIVVCRYAHKFFWNKMDEGIQNFSWEKTVVIDGSSTKQMGIGNRGDEEVVVSLIFRAWMEK